jgi:hypothetical protein
MLHQLSVIRSLEMTWHSFWHNRSHFLSLYLRPWLQFEPLIIFLICCCTIKLVRFVLGETDHVRAPLRSNFFEHLVMLPKLSLLLLCERLFVWRFTFKRQRIVWVLRSFLMENIVLPITPVWEGFRVWGMSKNWFIFVLSHSYFLLLWLCFVGLEIGFVSCAWFNFVRVYNFWFLFEIESFTLFHNDSILKFLFLEVFLVTWSHRLWIRVPHKLICDPSFPTTLISTDCVAM